LPVDAYHQPVYSGKMPVEWTMATKISMRAPATRAYVLIPKTMPIAIDDTRKIVAALDMLLM
jgi:hypothetical protein